MSLSMSQDVFSRYVKMSQDIDDLSICYHDLWILTTTNNTTVVNGEAHSGTPFVLNRLDKSTSLHTHTEWSCMFWNIVTCAETDLIVVKEPTRALFRWTIHLN